MKYKGYDIKILGNQGIGSYNHPLTNTPYGYEIAYNTMLICRYIKMSSSLKFAIETAKQAIDRLLRRQ